NGCGKENCRIGSRIGICERQEIGPQMFTRRSLIVGAASLLAAPAIVRAASLMPVRAYTLWDSLIDLSDYHYDGFNYIGSDGEKYCVNPVGRFSIKIRNGEIAEQ